MAIISRSHGLLFVQAPRTRSNALALGVLVPEFGGERIPTEDVRDAQGKIVAPRKHVTVAQLVTRGVLSADEIDRLCVFTTVRNPFDALVSAYLRSRAEYEEMCADAESWVHDVPAVARRAREAAKWSFGEWAEDRCRGSDRDQSEKPRHLYAKYLDGTDAVLMYERMSGDFAALCASLGLPHEHLPPVRFEPEFDVEYRDFYDDASRALVERAFRPDFEDFGYEW